MGRAEDARRERHSRRLTSGPRRPAGVASLSPSRLRPRVLARALGVWAATLAVLAALAVAAPSAAQAATLVSNAGTTGTGSGSLAGFDLSQEFTTGSNPEGYTLESVVFDFAAAPSGVTVKVGTGSAHNLTGAVTLTNPSSLVAGDLTFAAPAGTTLSASTTYVVVIEASSGAVRFNTGTGEDAGAAAGWGIADNSGFRNATSTAAFTSNTDVVTIGVEGTAVVPLIGISGGAAVTEGTAAEFTVTASSARSADITVNLSVSDAAGSDFVAAADEGSKTVTIAANATQATYSVTTQADTIDEPDGAVTVALASGTGYSVRPPNSASVTVRDDDEPLTLTVSGGPPVTEGTAALFTVTANKAPRADITVNLTVSDATGSDFVAAADEGAKTVTIASGSTSARFPVTTQDDDADEPDGAVTVALASGDGYVVGQRDSYGILVADNDLPMTITISGGAAVTEGTAAPFTVTASRARTADVTVNLSVHEALGSDFVAVANEGAQTVTIEAGETSASYEVTTQDDPADEPDGPVTVALAAGAGYSVGTPSSASVTVRDDDMPVPAVPTAATAGTQVSNLGQADAGTGWSLANVLGDLAQAFTTGNIGAILSAVVIDFSAAPSGLTVQLRTGVSRTSAGTPIATLTNPPSLVAGDLTFTAPANTVLSAKSTYWVVIEGGGGRVQGTLSDFEDTGGKTDWSIGNGSRQRLRTGSGGFQESNTSALSIRVEGTAFTAPSAPAAPNLSTASTTSLKVAWRAPTNDGGTAITDYDVRWREQYATTWTELADTTASAATRATITGLSPGSTYEVQVRAQNAAGAGAWSAGATGATAAFGEVSLSLDGSQCAACPAVPTATARPGPGRGQITLTWEPGTESGRPAVTSWIVTVGTIGDIGNVFDSNVTSHTRSGLTPGQSYRVTVTAHSGSDSTTTAGTVRAGTGSANPTAPTIAKVGLVSLPTHDANRDGVYDTYVRDDRILISVTFSEAMAVDAKGNNANVALRVDLGGVVKKFPLERVLDRGQTLRFAYAVRWDTGPPGYRRCGAPTPPAGSVCDRDTDGFALAPGTVGGVARTLVELSGGASVASAGVDARVDADLRLPPGQVLLTGDRPVPADAALRKVDGSKGSWAVGPRATGAAIAADSEGRTLTVSFDKALGAIDGFAAADRQQSFGIRATNVHTTSTHRQHPTGVALSGNGRTLTLTLGTPVRAADRVEVEYYGSVVKWGTSNQFIRVLRGTDGWQVPEFSGLHATNNLPGAPPIAIRAVVAGTTLRIAFDRALNTGSRPAGNVFRVDWDPRDGLGGRTSWGTGTAAVSGSEVTVTLHQAVLPGPLTPQVFYTKPAANPLKAAGAGGDAVYSIASFTAGLAGDVTAPSVAPHATALVIEGVAQRIDGVINATILAEDGHPGEAKIMYYFDEALDPTSVPAKTAFGLTGGTGTHARTMADVARVEVVGSALVMTTNKRFRPNTNFWLTYTKPTADPLRDPAGNEVATATWVARSFGIGGQPVPRGTTVTGDVVRIAMQQPLDPDSVPAPSAFTLWATDTETVDGKTTRRKLSGAVIAVAVESTSLVLRLSNPVLPCDSAHPFRVGYDKPALYPLQTVDEQVADSWGPEYGDANHYARAGNTLAAVCFQFQ